MTKTDVCIIGAGPAGAATSLMLTQLKIPHIIVDKALFPRDKPCGDGLVLHVFKTLNRINPDLLQQLLTHPNFIHGNAAKYYISPSIFIDVNTKPNLPHDPIFFGRRIDFDYFLVKNLPSEYAHVQLGVAVTDIEKNESGELIVKLENNQFIQPKIVIGAEGASSIVSKKLAKNNPSLNKDAISASISGYFTGIKYATQQTTGQIFIVHRKMPMYFYIFPLPNGKANISLVGSSELVAKHKINLREEAVRIIKNHPRIKHQFIEAEQEGSWRGWIIPSNFETICKSGDNFLLTGDALGLTNPFYKEGVGSAMLSGVMAAEHVRDCLLANRFDAAFNKKYDEKLSDRFSRLFKVSTLAFRLSKYPKIFPYVVWIFKRRLERAILNLIQRYTY